MLQDIYICLFHLYLGMENESEFHLYFTSALIYFIIFTILDFRLLSLLWKMQNQRALAPLNVSKRFFRKA